MRCTYMSTTGIPCNREGTSEGEKCVLHQELTEENARQKREALYSEIIKKVNDYTEVILPEIKLSGINMPEDLRFDGATIEGNADFTGVTIERDAWFNRVTIKGDASFAGATIGGNAWFEEATIEGKGTYKGTAWFERMTIKGNAFFAGATIEGTAWFEEATIGGNAWFNGTTIGENAWFEEATIGGNAVYERATIKGNAGFDGATIGGNAFFDGVTIKGNATFDRAIIEGDFMFGMVTTEEGNGRFDRAIIEGDIMFGMATIKGKAGFDGAVIEGNSSFDGATIERLHCFRTVFLKPKTQEIFCRRGKITQEGLGDRHAADDYFYREMGGKRKANEKRIKRYLEWPLQYVFGYGVKPMRFFLIWLSAILAFALFYWAGKGATNASSFADYLYFSVTTSATPGYGGYDPKPGAFQVLASFQAIFGTFMWASFIATFARKFMR